MRVWLARTARVLRSALTVPGVVPLVLLVPAFAAMAMTSTHFLDASYLLDRSSLSMETGLLVLAMTLVMTGGHIDLSCASAVALVACASAALHERCHWPMAVVLAVALLLGALLGGLNAALVAGLGLPSLAVTLGTMALYRGAAQILVGDHSLPLPEWFVGIDRVRIAGTPIKLPLVVFLSCAAICAVVLARSVFGRWVTAMGESRAAARYSGIPVGRVTAALFVLSGVMSALAGMMLASRLGVARFDHARGVELDVVTAVVLGGTSIAGGRGTVLGSVAALFLIAVLQTGMGVANVKAENQTTVLGALLIAAVLLTQAIERWRR